MNQDPLITGDSPLQLSDAVAALILVEDEGYLMQRRDWFPHIWYPDRWGLFGGGLDDGEDPIAALARELREELEFDLGEATFFSRFDFDLAGTGLKKYFRNYYVVPMSRQEYGRLVLHEGAEMRVFSGPDILTHPMVSPYDNFALYLHYRRSRLRDSQP